MGLYASSASPRIPPAQVKRRDVLFNWMRHVECGYTAREIVEATSIYAYLQGRQEKCAADLRALEKVGYVTRTEGRDPYWRVRADLLVWGRSEASA